MFKLRLFLYILVSTLTWIAAEEYRVEVAVAKCETALVKKGGGCSVSYIFSDRDGDFAIFKPKGEDSWGPAVKWFAGKWRRQCLQQVKSFQPFLNHIGGDFCCEIASERVAKLIKNAAGLPHDLVSPTESVTLILPGESQPKTGSLQLFEKGVVSGKEYLGLRLDYSIEKDSGQRREAFSQSFQWLVILDVITGHMDRHSNNFMVREVDGTLLAIDGGMSFSPWHPDPSEGSPTRSSACEEMNKLYYWANPAAEFELANRSFTEESKEAIKQIYERRFELQRLVEESYQNEGGTLGEERAQRMIERLEMLLIKSRCPSFKIKDLWDCRTKEQIEEILSARLSSPFPQATDKDALSPAAIRAILHLPSLLADKYHLVEEKCEPIEKILAEIAIDLDNADAIIDAKMLEIEATLAEIAS